MKIIIATGTRGNDLYFGLVQFMLEQVRRHNVEVIFGECSWSAVRAQEILLGQLQKRDYDFVLMVDADVAPPMDALDKLLALNLDIVGIPVWMASEEDVHINMHRFDSGMARIRTIQRSGVEAVLHVSFACILIRKNVFDRFAQHNESPFHPSALAGGAGGGVPDLTFNYKAQALGFTTHICWDVQGTIHYRPVRLSNLGIQHIQNQVERI